MNVKQRSTRFGAGLILFALLAQLLSGGVVKLLHSPVFQGIVLLLETGRCPMLLPGA